MVTSVIAWSKRHLDRSVTESLYVFVLTRGLIFAIFILVGHFAVGPPEIGIVETGPISARNATINLQDAGSTQTLRQTISQGDVNLYQDLGRRGYDRQPFGSDSYGASQYAFFPLLPGLLWLLGAAGLDPLVAATVLSNIFFLGSLILLYKLARRLNYDERDGSRTILYLAVFPVSYFFSLPMTESLFLLLTLAGFYTALDEKPLTAGIAGALASATRANGILLLPAIIILYWQRKEEWSMRKVLGLCLMPLGLIAYMLFSWNRTGDLLAFVHAQHLRSRQFGFFFGPLFDYLRRPYEVALPWNFVLLNVAVVLLAFVCAYLLLKQRQWALAAYTLLVVLLPLSSSSVMSMARYLSVCFPMFIALGASGRSPRVDTLIKVIFIALWGLMTVLFAGRFTMALT
jgi:hypothetical protein